MHIHLRYTRTQAIKMSICEKELFITIRTYLTTVSSMVTSPFTILIMSVLIMLHAWQPISRNSWTAAYSSIIPTFIIWKLLYLKQIKLAICRSKSARDLFKYLWFIIVVIEVYIVYIYIGRFDVWNKLTNRARILQWPKRGKIIQPAADYKIMTDFHKSARRGECQTVAFQKQTAF